MVTLPSLSMSEANPIAVFRSQSTARGRVWMTSSNVWTWRRNEKFVNLHDIIIFPFLYLVVENNGAVALIGCVRPNVHGVFDYGQGVGIVLEKKKF